MNFLIGNSVTSIGSHAFDGSRFLVEVINYSSTPQEIFGIYGGVFISNCTLRVPAASLDAYRAAPVWKEFGNIVAIE